MWYFFSWYYLVSNRPSWLLHDTLLPIRKVSLYFRYCVNWWDWWTGRGKGSRVFDWEESASKWLCVNHTLMVLLLVGYLLEIVVLCIFSVILSPEWWFVCIVFKSSGLNRGWGKSPFWAIYTIYIYIYYALHIKPALLYRNLNVIPYK